MRLIKTEVIEETRKTSFSPNSANISRTETTQKVLRKETKVTLDSYDQRTELADHLKSKNFKQTDGLFGEARDFGLWSAGNEYWIILSFQNQKRYERLIQTVVNWGKK